MSWGEFSDLLIGLTDTTPLVRIAQIRTESDPKVIKEMNAGQRSIRAEWQRKRALRKPQSETDSFIANVQKTFEKMFGDTDA